MKNAVAEQIIEAALGDYLNWAPQEFFKIRDQPTRKPGAGIRTNVNQEIDVALGSGIASRHGSLPSSEYRVLSEAEQRQLRET